MPEAQTITEPQAGTVDHALQGFAETVLRGGASPLPRDPATYAWQMIASRLAATAAHLMVELNEVDPARAARVAFWDAGPLGDGQDPVTTSAWVIKHVLEPAGVDVAQALDEALDAAVTANPPKGN